MSRPNRDEVFHPVLGIGSGAGITGRPVKIYPARKIDLMKPMDPVKCEAGFEPIDIPIYNQYPV